MRTASAYVTAIPLGRRLPGASSNLPGRQDLDRSRGPPRLHAKGPAPPLFGLAPGGVCRAAGVAAGAVRSYRTVSPLPRQTRNAPRRSVLCGTIPGLAPAGCYPAPLVHGARTFLPDPLPTPPPLAGEEGGGAGAAVRPTDKGWMSAPVFVVKGETAGFKAWSEASGCGSAHQWCGCGRDWPGGPRACCGSTGRQYHRCVRAGNGAGRR